MNRKSRKRLLKNSYMKNMELLWLKNVGEFEMFETFPIETGKGGKLALCCGK